MVEPFEGRRDSKLKDLPVNKMSFWPFYLFKAQEQLH